MKFEKGHIYHIYNQGNNKRKIFFKRANYLFFLKKIKRYILPYADILAWCLMPNHFHLMVLVNSENLSIVSSHQQAKTRTFNESIAIMLRSYTRAINKQQKFSGSLFRKHTKAQCLNCSNKVSPAWFTNHGVTQIHIVDPEREYPNTCFHYIHFNPVNAGLVHKAEAWEFSSAQDYAGIRNGKLVNKEKTKEHIKI